MGYSIKLAKSTMKDLKNLKSAHLEQKFKDIMEILKENPFQNPPPYEKLVGNLKDKYWIDSLFVKYSFVPKIRYKISNECRYR